MINLYFFIFIFIFSSLSSSSKQIHYVCVIDNELENSNPPKKDTTYDGGMEAEGFRDYASKTTKKVGHGTKQVTKTNKITGDLIGDIYIPTDKQTLTKTKTVIKNNKKTTKTKVPLGCLLQSQGRYPVGWMTH